MCKLTPTVRAQVSAASGQAKYLTHIHVIIRPAAGPPYSSDPQLFKAKISLFSALFRQHFRTRYPQQLHYFHKVSQPRQQVV